MSEIPGQPSSATSSAGPLPPAKRRRSRPLIPPTGSGSVRATQRAPQSCTECARRKIRCDKVQPCAFCVERGEPAASACRREAVYVRARGGLMGGEWGEEPVTLERLAREVRGLQTRLGALEEDRAGRPGPGLRLEGHLGAEREGQGDRERGERGIFSRETTPCQSATDDLDHGRLPGAMEEAALGIGETTRWMGSSLLATTEKEDPTGLPAWYQPVGFDVDRRTLPAVWDCRTLLAFYLEHVGWISGVVDREAFLPDFERFCSSWESHHVDDELWLGMLFAILSMTAFFMPTEEAQQIGITPHAPVMWFNAAISTLFRHHILTRPSLLACQIIQVLGPAFHLTGNKTLHESLTAIERSHARSINLHLLGSPAGDRSDATVRKNAGRRVWWNLVEVDWAFLPYNRYSQFSMQHFDTAPPASAALFENVPKRELVYRKAAYASARIVYDLFYPLRSDEAPSYPAVKAASRDMDALRKEILGEQAPAFLLDGPCAVERRLTRMTLSYRSYLIHRLFFVRAFDSSGEYSPSRLACTKAAEDILAAAAEGMPEVYHLLWNVIIMTVAAGIVLAFEALHYAGRQGSEGSLIALRLLVDRLRRLKDHSGIAARGATLIQHLLTLEGRLRSGQVGRLSFTRQGIFTLVNPEQSTVSTTAAHHSNRDRSANSVSIPSAEHVSATPFDLLERTDDLFNIWMPSISGPQVDPVADFADILNSMMQH